MSWNADSGGVSDNIIQYASPMNATTATDAMLHSCHFVSFEFLIAFNKLYLSTNIIYY